MKTHIPWRPMDTAPKDGTEIQVISTNKRVKTVRFDRDDNAYITEEGASIYPPTGWLPLPGEKGFEVLGIEIRKKLLRKAFEAGKKAVEEHPDDDSYDSVHFDRFFNEEEVSIQGIETFPPDVFPEKRDKEHVFSKAVIIITEGDSSAIGAYSFSKNVWVSQVPNIHELNFRWYYPPVSWEEVKSSKNIF